MDQDSLRDIKTLSYARHFRPNGVLGLASDNELITIDEELFAKHFGDENNDSGMRAGLKRQLEDREQRARIAKKVFGIDMKQGMRKKEPEKLADWYSARNRIAHGRGESKLLFATYIEADAFILRRIFSLSKQCKDKQLVWL